MVICLERGADLHMAQLMPLPLTVSCFSEIQIGFTILVLAHPGSHGKGPLKRVQCNSMSHSGIFSGGLLKLLKSHGSVCEMASVCSCHAHCRLA